MHWLTQARTWFVVAGLLTIAAIFIVGGAAGGVLAGLAVVTLIAAVFLRLRGEHPEDRPVGTGMFGGGGF
jgi:hypothetical protein